jgi:hypothetical protein
MDARLQEIQGREQEDQTRSTKCQKRPARADAIGKCSGFVFQSFAPARKYVYRIRRTRGACAASQGEVESEEVVRAGKQPGLELVAYSMLDHEEHEPGRIVAAM